MYQLLPIINGESRRDRVIRCTLIALVATTAVVLTMLMLINRGHGGSDVLVDSHDCTDRFPSACVRFANYTRETIGPQFCEVSVIAPVYCQRTCSKCAIEGDGWKVERSRRQRNNTGKEEECVDNYGGDICAKMIKSNDDCLRQPIIAFDYCELTCNICTTNIIVTTKQQMVESSTTPATLVINDGKNCSDADDKCSVIMTMLDEDGINMCDKDTAKSRCQKTCNLC